MGFLDLFLQPWRNGRLHSENNFSLCLSTNETPKAGAQVRVYRPYTTHSDCESLALQSEDQKHV